MWYNIKYNDNDIIKYNIMIKNGKQIENIWVGAGWVTPWRMNKTAFSSNLATKTEFNGRNPNLAVETQKKLEAKTIAVKAQNKE